MQTENITQKSNIELIELKTQLDQEVSQRKALSNYFTVLSPNEIGSRLYYAVMRYALKNNISINYFGDLSKIDIQKFKKQYNVGRTTVIELAKMQLEINKILPKP